MEQEDRVQPLGDSDDNRDSPPADDPGEGGSRSTTSDPDDPWPFLHEYLTFVSCLPGKNKYKNLHYRCTSCRELVKTDTSSRSNLTRHFKRNHPGRAKGLEKLLDANKNYNQQRRNALDDSTQPSVSQFLKRGGQPRIITQAVVDDKVLKFIINSSQPFTLVRNDSFQDLVRTLQPEKTVMTYRALKSKMKVKFAAMLSRVKSELEDANHVCVTADIWSDARRSFLGMTAHTLTAKDGCVERKSYALACKRIKGTHSYDVIAQALMDILESYNIQFKVAGIITDNGSNFCKAFKVFSADQTLTGEVGSDSQDEEEEEDEEIEFIELGSILEDSPADRPILLPPHYRCAAHTLSLVATKDSEAALKPTTSEYTKIFRSTFAKLQAVWNLYNRSPKFADSFKAKFETEQKGLLTPNATRWNSTFDAVKRFKEFLVQDQQAMEALLTEAKVKPLVQSEISFISEFLRVMGPVAEALDYLQGEKYMYLGYLVPTIKSLMRLLSERKEEVLVCKPLATALLHGVKNRFSSQLEDRQMIVAAVYLPVFKLDWLHDDRDTQETARVHLLQEMRAVGNMDKTADQVKAL